MQQPMTYVGLGANDPVHAEMAGEYSGRYYSIMDLWKESPIYRKGVFVGAGAVGALWGAAILFYMLKK